MSDIPAESEPFGVNDSGQVVGWSTVGNATRNAFLYSDGQMTDLGTLGGASYLGIQCGQRHQRFGANRWQYLRWLMDPVLAVNKRFWI